LPTGTDLDGSHQIQAQESQVREIVVGQGFPFQVGVQTAQPPKARSAADTIVGKIGDPYAERTADDYISYVSAAVE
jgi:hypothetical protein